MVRVLAPVISLAVASALVPGTTGAQSAGGARVNAAVHAAVQHARNLVDNGAGSMARALLDSLVFAQPIGSNESAEALYWRAVLAERAGDAERDWKQLVIEVPLSPRNPDALLWLGELELVRGHTAVARTYLDRLLRDYAVAPQRPKAMLWIARSYFDERDLSRACAMVTILRGAGVPDGELRLQTDEMQGRCVATNATPQPMSSPRESARDGARSASSATIPDVSILDSVVHPDANRGRFSVQLAAYDTRDEAVVAVQRFASLNIPLRIDGDRKPFRVRSGRYPTHAAAGVALSALRKRGVVGFVAEIMP